MGNDVGSRVIRPPMEDVTSGRVFRPDPRFKYKQWVEGTIVVLAFWGLTILVLVFAAVMNSIDPPYYPYTSYLNDWFVVVNLWYWIGALFWYLPMMMVIPFYVRTFEYSVSSMEGRAMKEIFVKKGLVNVTKKHVPFRTITNILSRAGPLDRLFGIGTIEIETAGFSGSPQGGRSPEEKIEGILFYEEVRDYILQELRRFRDPYVTGTEIVQPADRPVPHLPDSLDDEMLITLRAIRDVLTRIGKKLDKEEE
ncbi:PH domain-containing protein [Candidatus Thorarchaeota archaeon]|nr:MAG: PH domain-containing protein [Candidatus Thorarchaeota archaeon]